MCRHHPVQSNLQRGEELSILSDKRKDILVLFDDREFTNDQIRMLVGDRRYGDIIYQRRSLHRYLMEHVPEWLKGNVLHLRNRIDLVAARKRIEQSADDAALLIISSRAGITSYERLAQLFERLPYAEENFVDRRYKPLLSFYADGHAFLNEWERFSLNPIHAWEEPTTNAERLTSLTPVDLASIKEFLSYMRGATEARHFNKVEIDNYFYTKCSSDKKKMKAEYQFYSLVPESIRPWLVQPFDYIEESDQASYKMMRFYLADAALQWVHSAFSMESFELFIDRLLFFINNRPKKTLDKAGVQKEFDKLFIKKVDERVEQLLQTNEGARLNQMLAVTNPSLDIRTQVTRYKGLLEKYQKSFLINYLVVGHGDPCFSNILYDQERYLLMLIDPKGATSEADIWTHPLYDLCKISHSVLGNYDFVNNGLYDLTLDQANRFELRLHQYRHDPFKDIFRRKLQENNYDWKVIRLAEASLFLSMLPLHLDHPNKVAAFILTANKILDEIEYGQF